jgi:hypothetical protein
METHVAYIIVNKNTGKFVGKDNASGGYPWESFDVSAMTIWPTETGAQRYCNVPGFKSFGSDDWIVKSLYYK